MQDCSQLALEFAIGLKVKLLIADASMFFRYVLISFCTSSADAPYHGLQITTGFSRATIDTEPQEFQDREASGELCQTAAEAEESAFQQVEHPSNDCLVLVHCQFPRSQCKNRMSLS